MKPRLFLSHSAKEPDTLEVLEALHAHLVEAGFDVFLDRQRLRAGQRWRQVLHNWMNLCHGAVLLVSDKVAPRNPKEVAPSEFVPIEASVLTNRRETSPGFPFVVLQMAHVDGDRLKEGIWKSLRLREEQFVRGLTPDNLGTRLEEITDPFRPLLRAAPRTPLEEVEDEVTGLLRDLPAASLELAAKALADLGADWDSRTREPARELARLLLRAELREVWSAMRHLRQANLAELYYFVAPSWIDYRAVIDLVRLGKGELTGAEDPARGVAINGRQLDFTPAMFCRRADARPREFAWGIKEVPPAADAPASYYETRTRAALQELTMANATEPEELDRQINDCVSLLGRDQPFFVALPWPGPGADTLARLQTRYPEVCFFLLTEKPRQDHDLLSRRGIRFLSPELSEAEENQARTLHDFIQSRLGT